MSANDWLAKLRAQTADISEEEADNSSIENSPVVIPEVDAKRAPPDMGDLPPVAAPSQFTKYMRTLASDKPQVANVRVPSVFDAQPQIITRVQDTKFVTTVKPLPRAKGAELDEEPVSPGREYMNQKIVIQKPIELPKPVNPKKRKGHVDV